MVKTSDLFIDKPGKKVALLGNEAIARSIIESGVSALFTYPGTPSSEIPNTLYQARPFLKKMGYKFYFEWSTNEKTALEGAYGYTFSGQRVVFVCKHVGLNVAADPLLTLINAGVKGGLVIIEAEDPHMYSSQNEQDNRHFAKLANIPILEPSDAQEAMTMLKEAFRISEEFEIPVILRSVTRISHSKSDIEFSEIKYPKIEEEISVQIDPKRFVCVPGSARVNKVRLLETIDKLSKSLVDSKFNFLIKGNNSKFVFITSGSAYVYLKDIFTLYDLKYPIVKIGISHPFPTAFLAKTINSFRESEIIVVEEADNLLEVYVKQLAQEIGFSNKIYGRIDKVTPNKGEITIRILAEGLKHIIKDIITLEEIPDEKSELLIPRPPVLCPGCPHRGSFYILNRVIKKSNRLVSTDIGCYTLGFAPPLSVGNVVIDMGSSFGIGHGLAAIEGIKEDVVAVIGDSTFWASGLPGLTNAVYNKTNLTALIVDNSCTAMTGFQPHPSSEPNPQPATMLNIQKVCEAVGATVTVIDPFHPKKSIEKLKQSLDNDGVNIVISKGECRINYQRREGLPNIRYQVTAEECRVCHSCVNLLGCPAIMFSKETKTKGKLEKEIPIIDQEICTRCGLCVEVCPYDVIRPINGGN